MSEKNIVVPSPSKTNEKIKNRESDHFHLKEDASNGR